MTLCHLPFSKINDYGDLATATLKVLTDSDRPVDMPSLFERISLIGAWEKKLKVDITTFRQLKHEFERYLK